MYRSHLAQSAYAPSTATFKPAKDVEYDAFAKITGAMKSAQTMPEKVAALHRNKQLWNILAIDVADPENALPMQLRAEILSLAQFTGKQTSKILAGSDGIDVLVEINTSIMRGLRPPKRVAA
ncbi:flagellar protein FlaF [Palleronia aestuarii]|uniref:Flagellar protein FlaF n=1 Tax=Palleronia aestuarii TaxID=568105 RepID=A0A2W7NP88_9RHOB|nr:flagellar biosynthesis regulator FlaF [Palleronia aestuarii]PZX15066.1 flagellar protein FlaF [Palleronia aestuarii]